ncbi:hypothetical protein JW905_04895 [bacterium]|nr:hypothetical protein [candidate division CSSED10-310 bacterium]
MTSINAVKFNDRSGLMICDEQRGWNDEGLKINTADKIKPIIPDEITARYGLIASYGNTGTSSIGDELKFTIHQEIAKEFEQRCNAHGGPPDEFMTMAEVADLIFRVQTRMKRSHIDQTLLGRYGFTANDYCRGYYQKDGRKIDIKNADILSEIEASLVWKDRKGEMTSIFLNGGITAGYEPREGFRIFAFSLIDFYYEPVQEAFLADGSGRDLATIVFTDYLNAKTVPERRGDLDPVDATIAALEAVNAAVRFNLGVDGYFNIILFDGAADVPGRMREINDHRAKLASEIVSAYHFRLIGEAATRELVDALLFKDNDFTEINERLMSAAADAQHLKRFLRGYRV